MNTLVIVESPAKAKKIQGILGSDFKVVSCKGHVRDLPVNGMSIDITEDAFVPHYAIVEDREAVINELKPLAKKVDAVLLATDPDREGEAIAWHLIEALNLPPATTKRITFTEITEATILNAVQKPRAIYQSLVDAQQARRILDRLVGYELSPLLWRQRRLGARAAGRVQSVALRLLVDREREIQAFQPASHYRLSADFALIGEHIITTKGKLELNNKEDAFACLNRCIGAAFTVRGIVKSPSKSSPPAPFITSSLQQEASSRLGFGVDRTMSLAQKLYEAGHISYMRSDYLILAPTVINEAREFITHVYGERYCNPGNHHPVSGNAQQGHEAIRPTDFTKRIVTDDASAQKLYELIWKRTLASQMPEAIFERLTVTISSAQTDLEFNATCRSLRFDGFTRIYETASDDDSTEEQEPMLPDMQVGQELGVVNIVARQVFSRPKGRYTEASLVGELEKRGIGRPSTYASTVSVIKKRDYVQKRDAEGIKRECEEFILKGGHITRQTREEMVGKERSKLVPTDLGIVVTDYLVRHFDRVMDYKFTAKIELELDAIANDERDWQQMLVEFYGPFHTLVEETRASPDRIESKRMLGVDPISGQPVSGRLGRFGPVIMIGEAAAPGADQSARFHSLRPGQSIFTITLQEALDLFNLPRTLGEIDGKPVLADVNERGAYVKHDGIYAALDAGKGDVPETVSLERALELLKMRQEAQARRIIKSFPARPDMTIIKKRWDAFLKVGRIEIKIPRDLSVSDLSLEQALQLAEHHQPKKKSRTRGKRSAQGGGAKRAPKEQPPAKRSKTSE